MIIYVLLDVTFLAFAITLKFNPSIKDMLGDFDVLRSFTEQLFVIAIWFCIIKILDLIQKEKKFFVSPINTLIRTIGIIVVISATLSNTLYNLIYGLLNSDFTLMLMLKINITGLVFGIAIMILSFAIEHGVKLQNQDDETL